MRRIALSTLAFLLTALTRLESPAAQDWKREWDMTVQAAKSEGEVAIYGPHNPMYRPLWELFQKSVPGVKINFQPGKGAELTQKILNERRAGQYLADLLMGGSSSFVSYPAGALERLRPNLIVPETYDESSWWQKKLWFADPQNQSAVLLTG